MSTLEKSCTCLPFIEQTYDFVKSLNYEVKYFHFISFLGRNNDFVNVKWLNEVICKIQDFVKVNTFFKNENYMQH